MLSPKHLIFLFVVLVAGCEKGSESFSSAGPSANAALSDLTIYDASLDQFFQPGVFSYSSTVDFLTASITVTAITSDQNATIMVNGNNAQSAVPTEPIPLMEGENTITIVVMAEDGSATESYSIRVTRQAINSFSQQAYIKASRSVPDAEFGRAVSISGDTLAVGAPREDNSARGINGNQDAGQAIKSGAVYVFVRDGSGMWSQQAYIKASNADPNDKFGTDVALDGNTLIVGAPGEQSVATGIGGDQSDNTIPSGSGSGAVYVFTRDASGAWAQQEYIKASNTDAFDSFGSRVALSNDTIAVGVFNEDSDSSGIDSDQNNNEQPDSGAVYVFVRNGANNWSQEAYIKASNSEGNDLFGFSIAMHEDTIAVGSMREDSDSRGINGDQSNNNSFDSGAAYVFRRDESGNWSQEAYLKASNNDEFDSFGVSIAIHSNTIVVGADEEDSSTTGVDGDQFDNSLPRAGAAYVFHRDDMGMWSQEAYIKSSNTDDDLFGVPMSLFKDTLVIGAIRESSGTAGINGNEMDNSEPRAGAAYIFVRSGSGVWEQKAYVKSSNTDPNDHFAIDVSIANGSLAIGANDESSNAIGVNGNQNDNSSRSSGAVYVFQ